ncbi:MAG: hypothetical protein J5826_05600 [Bacteroidales bacterium]|nr:hypothetical protein [Bacteroidales bacterium]
MKKIFNNRYIWFILIALVVTALLVIFLPESSFARPGGGHGYHGGDRSDRGG